MDLVVVDITALGEQRRDPFRRIVRAAAANTDERLGSCLATPIASSRVGTGACGATPANRLTQRAPSASWTRLMTSELRKMEGPQMIMAVFAPSRSSVPQRPAIASVSHTISCATLV